MRNEEPRKRERLCSYSFLILRDRREPTSFYSVYPFSLLFPSSLLFTFKLHLPLQHDVIDGCDSLLCLIYISPELFISSLSERREKRFLFFSFKLGVTLLPYFRWVRRMGGDLRLCRSSSWASRKKKILRNNNNKKKRKKNDVTFSPVSQNDSGRVEKQLNVQTRYIVWIPY